MRRLGEKIPLESINMSKPEVGWLEVDGLQATFARSSNGAWTHAIFSPLRVRRVKVRGAIFIFGEETPLPSKPTEMYPQVWMCHPVPEPELDGTGHVVEEEPAILAAHRPTLDIGPKPQYTGKARGPCAECAFNGGFYEPERQQGSVICKNSVRSGRHVCRLPHIGCAAFVRRPPGAARAVPSPT